MKKFDKQRIAVLVDAENLEISSVENHGGKIDYSKLLEKVNGREIVRALYYKPLNKLTNGLKYVLNNFGYEIKTTPKNVDCWLTIDAITLAEKCDVIVLVGGDADYVPLVWYLKSRGARVEVWMWKNETSALLIESADEYVPLTDEFLLQR